MKKFYQEIEKLRNRPITIDSWAYFEVGRGNDGFFKENYQYLKVQECGEGVVDASQCNVSNEDCYYEKHKKIIVWILRSSGGMFISEKVMRKDWQRWMAI